MKFDVARSLGKEPNRCEITIDNLGLSAGDGPIRLSSTGEMPPGMRSDVDYVVVSVASQLVTLERSRPRARLALWALAMAAVLAVVAAYTGEWLLAAAAWVMLTILHVESSRR